MNVRYFSLPIIATCLIFLPRCDWFSKTGQTSEQTSAVSMTQPDQPVAAGEVLLTINGTPRITILQFEDYKKNLMETQPQLKQLIGLMPDAEFELFKSMKNEEILKDYIKKNKIDQTAQYKKDWQMILDFAERQLAAKYFQEAHPVKVSDADVRKFYEENKKQLPELMVSKGGVTAQVVSFDKPADASAFMTKAKEKGFTQTAKEMNAKIENYKDVGAASYEIEAPLREKLQNIKKFPTIEMVTGKDKTYVINATSKSEAEYVPFDQIKSRIEMYLQQQKMAENFSKELQKLEKEVNAIENKEYFDRIKKQREEEMKKMIEQEKAKEPKKVSQADQPLKAS